ncbi:MaoC family dehydratase [Sinorhizobium sp. BG8]|uniref:MaoC family dehydratase n=1 Tax=Sinorhizobium sp. BG8 TaxID=2613773 RepID=UPI00193E9DA8|nr:MaoC family dehydratase [Sinorhizobium sp. BG8]QRM56287.1 MaoC family dehydratase [Sinorhizobium sp. BG8]
MRMAELYPVGEIQSLGSHRFDSEEIIRYARQFDPQPFHLDAEAARDSLFGGLCASGWHTCAGWMKCFTAFWAREEQRLASQGVTPPKLGPSPGFLDLRWLKPVFAGDTITYSVTLTGSRALASRPGRLINTLSCAGENQHGEPVIRFTSTVLEFE